LQPRLGRAFTARYDDANCPALNLKSAGDREWGGG
jgi:hypothetical protein